jgi:RNA polymerase sigma-70 factor (ECF subfamily)
MDACVAQMTEPPSAPVPIDAPSDLALIAQVQAHGSREALERLLQRHAESAYRVALRLTGHASDAEDVVQDACLRCMASLHTFRGEGTPRSWFLTIVANAARQRMTSEQRRSRREQGASPRSPATVPDQDLAREVQQALSDLPEKYRTAVAMRYLDDLSFSDISAALQTREKSVRTRTSRGLERLRILLQRRGVSVGAGGVAAVLSNTHAPLTPPGIPAQVAGAIAHAPLQPLMSATGASMTLLAKALVAFALGVVASSGIAVLACCQRPFPLMASPDRAVQRDEETLAHDLRLNATIGDDALLDNQLFELVTAMPAGHHLRVTATPGTCSYLHCGDRPVQEPDDQRLLLPQQAFPYQTQTGMISSLLDACCARHDRQWRQAAGAVILERRAPDAVLDRLTLAFAMARSPAELDRAALALASSSDLRALRPLLLALASPGAASDAATRALKNVSLPWDANLQTFDHAFLLENWPSPLIAFHGDTQVTSAVLAAVSRRQEPMSTLLRISGQMRLEEVVAGCEEEVSENQRALHGFACAVRHALHRGETSDVLGVAAAQALGWIRDPQAVPTLLSAIHDDQVNHAIDIAVLNALGRIGDARALPLLDRRLTDQAYWTMPGVAAIHALGWIGDEHSIATCTALTRRHEAYIAPLCGEVALALWTIGTPQARSALEGLAQQDSTFGSPSAIHMLGLLRDRQSEGVLLTLLQGETGETAAPALGETHDPSLVTPLSSLLTSSKNPDTYRHITMALSGLQLPESEAVLISSLPAADSPLLWYHVKALGQSPASVALIKSLVEAKKPESERRIAAHELARLDAAGLAQAQDLILHDPDLETRMAAMEGCSGMHLPLSLIEPWTALPEPQLRATAVQVIQMSWWLGFDILMELRLKALQDRDPLVRLAVLNAPDGQCVAPLQERKLAAYEHLLASDPDPEVRFQVSEHCLSWPLQPISQAATAQLTAALLHSAASDEESRVRAKSGQTLVRMLLTTKLAMPHLNTSFLQEQVALLLTQLRQEPDPQVVGIVQHLLAHPEEALNTPFDWHAEARPAQTHPRSAF